MQHLGPSPVRRRRYWSWLALSLPLVAVAAWLVCWQMYHDPSRARAIALYESLKPQMSRRDVWDIMTQYADTTQTKYDEGSCCIDHRFNLTYSFDDQGELSHKVLLEFGDHSSTLPNWMVKLWLSIGFPTDRVHRSWP